MHASCSSEEALAAAGAWSAAGPYRLGGPAAAAAADARQQGGEGR